MEIIGFNEDIGLKNAQISADKESILALTEIYAK